MAGPTLNQLLLDSLRRHERPDLLWHKQGGAWRPISSGVFLRRGASLARALEEMGLRKGDRVGLFSENCPEWHVVDLACLGLGAVTVPIYAAESVERLNYILKHSEARICFVSGAEQFEKVKAAWKELPRLKQVVPFAVPVSGDERVVGWAQVVADEIPEARVEEFERRAREQQPEDVATLIYTSGTTGTPKGALLTQGNFGSNVESSLGILGYRADDLAMSLLPLCHIFERTNAYIYLSQGASVAYAEGFEKITDNLREMRPTVMAVVPRFFEKFYGRLLEVVKSSPAPRRKLFEWAVQVGREALPCRLAGTPLPAGLAVRYRLADFFIYRKVRERLGGRMRYFISGGAPLARELNEFFHALGLTIFEGYGLTETSPVIAVNRPGEVKLGTVGRPIPGVEVKVAPDGEVLTRGPHVMKEYFKMGEETRAAVDEEGWFHTGDVGFLDEDGFLTITDRKKDLIKTAGGKMIAPQPIENRLKASPYIEAAVVIGDRRRYPTALLVPNFALLERQARTQGLSFDSRSDLVAHASMRALLEAAVESVNRDLAQYERIKRFAVLDRDFSFSDGQLTYTQKVRRRKIEEEYRELIEQLYREEVASPA
ncbi:MAG: AMP-dependent synthetase/ligase [Terriglobia bacterium]